MADGPGFGARLRAATAARGPLCVGIDPHPGLLRDWGLPDTAPGLERFARTVVEALGERVAVLKPQSAFFERFGSRGIAVLETVLAEARAAGAIVILDAKRGDIGSTVAAYADAYLDRGGPLFADALTASPYLGFGSLEPLFAAAERSRAGVFVLALTSNPEGAAVQRAVGPDGRGVAEAVVAQVAARNAGAVGRGSGGGAPDDRRPGDRPLGDVGVVIGATLDRIGLELGGLGGPILAPGIGAQGARGADIPRLFGPAARDVLPSVSRAVLRAGPDVAGLRRAARSLAEECTSALA